MECGRYARGAIPGPEGLPMGRMVVCSCGAGMTPMAASLAGRKSQVEAFYDAHKSCPSQSVDHDESRPVLDRDAVDRGVAALSRFVFPGCFVPRHEMVKAVIHAMHGGDDWMDRLPRKRIIRPDGHARAEGNR